VTVPTVDESAPSRRRGKSAAAVFLGFLVVFALSIATDQLLHVLNIYPPWGQPMFDTGLYILALSYRSVYTVIGGYVTAKLAPHSPMRHVWALGIIGFFVAIAGAIATIPLKLGPAWYPIVLALIGLPCVWLGGVLYLRRHPELGSGARRRA
jgi:hypothetical protein